MIEAQGLTRRYGAVTALAGVSFRVETGQIAGLLGPNGAGKSTVMKILTGSLAASGGSCMVAGRDLANEPLAARRAVGFMPEHVALPGDESVWSMLEFVADLKGVPRDGRTARLEELLEQTGLQDVRHRLSGRLSHGFRKRLGLAQALVGDPPVLVLDEPTSGLDPNQIVGIRELIRGMRGQRTVLMSSHILSEVSALCERVVILDRGRVVAERSGDGLGDGDGAGASARKVVLSWDGDRALVAAALARVAGVDEVVITETGAEVSIAGNAVEIRPRLVESVIQAGGHLQNIHDKGPSLEDLFLSLTGAKGQAATSAATATPPAMDETARTPNGDGPVDDRGEEPA
jgi:ABC-2 type transport system ATP-binding protein